MGPNLPLFIGGCAMLLYLFTSKPFNYLFKKMRMMQDDEDWDLDENLGSFFECIEPWIAKKWYTKTVYNNEKLGLKVMDNWQLEHLSTAVAKKKHMTEPCNYDILSNYKYAKMYQYTSIELRDTEEEKTGSEMLVRVLNLGFLPEHYTFEFMREQKIPHRATILKRRQSAANKDHLVNSLSTPKD